MSRHHLSSLKTLAVLSVLFVVTGCSNAKQMPWDRYLPTEHAGQQIPKTTKTPPAQQKPQQIENTAGDNQFLYSSAKPRTDDVKTRQIPANLPPVKVGFLAPLSGQHQAVGEALLNAAQVALFDIGTQNFELVPKDTKGTPDGAKAAFQAASQEGAELIIGPLFSSSVKAIRPLAKRANINVITFSTDWKVAGGNIFSIGFLPFDQVSRIASYAGKKGHQRVAIFAPDNDYSRIVVTALRNTSRYTGMSLGKVSLYNPSANDLDAQAAGFLSSLMPGDAVLLPMGGGQLTKALNTLERNRGGRARVQYLGTGLWDDRRLTIERSLNGGLYAAPFEGQRKKFEHRYAATFSQKPPRIASLAYDATALAAVLAYRGQVTNGRAAFDRKTIADPSGFSGVDGVFRFRPDGLSERGLAIYKIDRGRRAIIDHAPRSFRAQHGS